MACNAKNETFEPVVLHERDLIYFAPRDSGWVADRAKLPDDAKSEFSELLAKHVPVDELKRILSDLQRAFGDAVDADELERGMTVAAEASSEAKKLSAKLWVHLRSRIDELMTVLAEGTISSERICAQVLEDPILEKLATLQLKEPLSWQVTNPLRNAPALAGRLLIDVLPDLRRQIV